MDNNNDNELKKLKEPKEYEKFKVSIGPKKIFLTLLDVLILLCEIFQPYSFCTSLPYIFLKLREHEMYINTKRPLKFSYNYGGHSLYDNAGNLKDNMHITFHVLNTSHCLVIPIKNVIEYILKHKNELCSDIKNIYYRDFLPMLSSAPISYNIYDNDNNNYPCTDHYRLMLGQLYTLLEPEHASNRINILEQKVTLMQKEITNMKETISNILNMMNTENNYKTKKSNTIITFNYSK